MNIEDAIIFLKSNQPLPGDEDISDEEIDTFAEILYLLESEPDERTIPLLIGVVGSDHWMGVYESIGKVLMKHTAEKVEPHIRDGLLNGNNGTKFRCCYWACEVEAWNLSNHIEPLTSHDDVNVSDAAKMYLNIRERNVGRG